MSNSTQLCEPVILNGLCVWRSEKSGQGSMLGEVQVLWAVNLVQLGGLSLRNRVQNYKYSIHEKVSKGAHANKGLCT